MPRYGVWSALGLPTVGLAPFSLDVIGLRTKLTTALVGVTLVLTAVAMPHSAGAATPATDRVPFKTTQAFVSQQYRDFLGREVDPDGLAFWVGRMDQGWSGRRVINAFMDSPEFGRITAPVLRIWLAATGTTPHREDTFRVAVMRFRSGTPLVQLASEVVGNSTTVDRNGVSVASKSDRQFVTDVYRFIYGIAPAPERVEAGLGILSRGTSRASYMGLQVTTKAVIERLVPEVYVGMSYLGMLNRLPEASGYNFWVPAVRNGRSVRDLIGAFQRSTEYARRVT